MLYTCYVSFIKYLFLIKHELSYSGGLVDSCKLKIVPQEIAFISKVSHSSDNPLLSTSTFCFEGIPQVEDIPQNRQYSYFYFQLLLYRKYPTVLTKLMLAYKRIDDSVSCFQPKITINLFIFCGQRNYFPELGMHASSGTTDEENVE